MGAQRAVFFDLDGTLLNTLDDLAASMNEVLNGWGCQTHTAQDYRHFIGDGVHMLAMRALPPALRTEKLVQDAVQAFRQVYSRRWKEKTRPYPGIKDMLKTLAEQEILMGVVSNKPHEPTLICVQTFFQQTSFAVVQGHVQDFPPKPDPSGLLSALQACGAHPGYSLYLGDSGVDMKAARGAGMRAVGVEWGFRSREELMEHGAEYVLHDPRELMPLMGRLFSF